MNRSKTLRLNVKVYPRSRKQEIIRLSADEYKIHVTSPPSKGEANHEVCKLVAAHFGVPFSRVRIVGGIRSRNKVVTIEHNR